MAIYFRSSIGSGGSQTHHYLIFTGVLLAVVAALITYQPAAASTPLVADLEEPNSGVSSQSALTDDFVITVKTDNPGTSADTQFTIPTTGGGYNYNVDCDNDGTDEVTGATGNYTCDYGSACRAHTPSE